MRSVCRLCPSACFVVALCVVAGERSSVSAQNPPAEKKPAAATAPAQPARKAPAATAARQRPKYRALAPGVMREVDPRRQTSETFTRRDMVEVLAADPKFAERDWSAGTSPAKNTVIRRDIWTLDFAFKPVRFVRVDVPAPEGRLQNKLVWYLVYSLKNTTDAPITFVPRIVLMSKDTGKVYPDRLVPLAVPLIRGREDRNRPLLNTIEITGRIPPATKAQDGSVWGVATWEDIDPTTDRFSIYIQGLTNAYEWIDPPGAFKEGDQPGTGREFFAKTLILNFWRPSDKEYEHEDEIRFDNYQWEYGQLTPQGFVAKKPDPAPNSQPPNPNS
ncbi:MAG: hypothetical protein HYX69_07785 [Planctomycetia bacterium]|nr:hypothetical protein [Planctomycetia bacterium]